MFDPFWARVNEAGITVVVHAGDAGLSSNGYAPDGFAASFKGGPGGASIKMFAIERAAHDFLATLILERLFDRFPNVRIASVENGSEFLAPLFRKLAGTARKMPGYFNEDPVRHLPAPRVDQSILGGRRQRDRRPHGGRPGHLRVGLAAHRRSARAHRLGDRTAKTRRRISGQDHGGQRVGAEPAAAGSHGAVIDTEPVVDDLFPPATTLLPHVIVLFGATGDLAARKLLPGLLHLSQSGLLPDFRIVGTSLSELTDEEFRHVARHACDQFATGKISLLEWAGFEQKLSFVSQSTGAAGLAAAVTMAENSLGGEARRLHYLSIPPGAAGDVVQMLREADLVERSSVIMEKPFGTDLASAKALNATVHEIFREDQVFRIDHFLGKEAAQNILAFRFANGLFEPIWNRDHIDHVQIDVPETLSVDDRVGFYETTGAFKDMVVTHLFQILGFMAMEPPTALESRAISEEKNKVFRSLRPIDVSQVVRGQYEGYRQTPGVAPDSDTETFVALRCEIDNWRWAGVPFFLRTGKELGERGTHHLHRLPRAAQEHVPARLGRRGQGTGPPHLRPGRRRPSSRSRSTARNRARA